jgi:hypothetical protein
MSPDSQVTLAPGLAERDSMSLEALLGDPQPLDLVLIRADPQQGHQMQDGRRRDC